MSGKTFPRLYLMSGEVRSAPEGAGLRVLMNNSLELPGQGEGASHFYNCKRKVLCLYIRKSNSRSDELILCVYVSTIRFV